MSKDNVPSRRRFLATTAAATAGAATVVQSVSRSNAAPLANANSRLRIGFIGVGNQSARCQVHVNSAIKLQKEGLVECAVVCDVFNRYRDETAAKIEQQTGVAPTKTGDYRTMIDDPSIDAIVISTPDHWHARQTIDALKAGKHVYCEKPMTHTVDEAIDVYRTWQASGKVMQVGVQSTSLPVWGKLNADIRSGKLGKIMQYQTEYFRNSNIGQWRYYKLTEDMTPKNIDWDMFVGHELGLAPKQLFDRARFAQWRRFWDFGSGMYTDLFVHRTTSMLKATGLRWPGRVVGGGGLFLEYDGREAPDVATVITDFYEGCQGVVTATMCNANTPPKQVIRGHFGSAVLGIGEDFGGYDFVAERPQVTLNSKIKDERVDTGKIENTSFAHFKNFCEAITSNDPQAVNCSPKLGAAAMVVVKLGAKSYRDGKVFHFDPETLEYSDGDASWAKRWEEMSYTRAQPKHVAGWAAGDTGSKLIDPEYQYLEGPWKDGIDPAAG